MRALVLSFPNLMNPFNLAEAAYAVIGMLPCPSDSVVMERENSNTVRLSFQGPADISDEVRNQIELSVPGGVNVYIQTN